MHETTPPSMHEALPAPCWCERQVELSGFKSPTCMLETPAPVLLLLLCVRQIELQETRETPHHLLLLCARSSLAAA